MKKYFKVCGRPIILYSENKEECYYDVKLNGVTIRRTLTVNMLKSLLKQIRYDCRCDGYDFAIVQDAICMNEINLIQIRYVR